MSLEPQTTSSPHHSICSSLKEERSSPSSIIKEEISNTSSITSMYPSHSHHLQNDNGSGMHHDAHMSHPHQAHDEQMDKISYRGIFTTTDPSSSMLSKFDIELGRQLNSPQMTLMPGQMSPPSASINGWNLPSPDKLFQPPLFLLGTQGKH